MVLTEPQALMALTFVFVLCSMTVFLGYLAIVWKLSNQKLADYARAKDLENEALILCLQGINDSDVSEPVLKRDAEVVSFLTPCSETPTVETVLDQGQLIVNLEGFNSQIREIMLMFRQLADTGIEGITEEKSRYTMNRVSYTVTSQTDGLIGFISFVLVARPEKVIIGLEENGGVKITTLLNGEETVVYGSRRDAFKRAYYYINCSAD